MYHLIADSKSHPVPSPSSSTTSKVFTQTESEFFSSPPSSNFVTFESTVKSSSKSTFTSPSPFMPLHTASASDHLQADQPWFRCPPEATSNGKGCQLTAFPSSDPSTGEWIGWEATNGGSDRICTKLNCIPFFFSRKNLHNPVTEWYFIHLSTPLTSLPFTLNSHKSPMQLFLSRSLFFSFFAFFSSCPLQLSWGEPVAK